MKKHVLWSRNITVGAQHPHNRHAKKAFLQHGRAVAGTRRRLFRSAGKPLLAGERGSSVTPERASGEAIKHNRLTDSAMRKVPDTSLFASVRALARNNAGITELRWIFMHNETNESVYLYIYTIHWRKNIYGIRTRRRHGRAMRNVMPCITHLKRQDGHIWRIAWRTEYSYSWRNRSGIHMEALFEQAGTDMTKRKR